MKQAFEWYLQESNQGHQDFQSCALPTELRYHPCNLQKDCKFILFLESCKPKTILITPFSYFYRVNQAYEYLKTPLGLISIEASQHGLTRVTILKKDQDTSSKPNEFTTEAVQQLGEYFMGTRKEFDVPLDTHNYSEFYRRVWKELIQITYGHTVSYLELALKLGDKNSVRAVGTANGRNPIGIIIPCHRVIGSDGKMVGYAGGIEAKKYLLRHELHHSPKPAHLLF